LRFKKQQILRKKIFPQYQNVEILSAAAEGKAVARIGELVVFVTGVVPGDIVDVQITKKKSRYQEGIPIKFHQYSEKRTIPKCEHFGICGGCQWQHLKYEEQLFYKQQQVVDNLERIAKVQLPDFQPIMPSQQEYEYRNKLEYSFSNKRWFLKGEIDSELPLPKEVALGFHIPEKFDKVLDIKHCHLQREPSNKIRLAVKNFAVENNLPFFDLKTQEGFLRTLVIRTTQTGETMVILTFKYEDKTLQNKLLQFIADSFPEISSLMFAINIKLNSTFADLPIFVFKGKDHIIEKMDNLQFKIGPKSFFQTNSKQAYQLYNLVSQFADFQGDEIVYDLYTGTGTIANFIAKKVKKVIGIEFIEDAIIDARNNSILNNIENTLFYAGDVKDILVKSFIELNGKPKIIILDPPRAGIHNDVLNNILQTEPQKIIYVSCNPATLSRDINLLSAKYRLTKIRAVDMFPHTSHVESIALLEKF